MSIEDAIKKYKEGWSEIGDYFGKEYLNAVYLYNEAYWKTTSDSLKWDDNPDEPEPTYSEELLELIERKDYSLAKILSSFGNGPELLLLDNSKRRFD